MVLMHGATEPVQARWWSLGGCFRETTIKECDVSESSYRPPRITELGTVAALTRGLDDGPKLDAAFPDNTPKDELTFS